jgi:predicted RNase H-like HicB family nuclease
MTMTTSPKPTANARAWEDDYRRWQPESQPPVWLPQELFDRYVGEALRPATPRQTGEGHYYCALDRFPGVWAEGASLAECLDVLEEVLRDWILVKIVNGDADLPVVDQIDLTTISRCFQRGR